MPKKTKKSSSNLTGLIKGGKKKGTNKKKLFFGALAAVAVLAVAGVAGKYLWTNHEYAAARASAGGWTRLSAWDVTNLNPVSFGTTLKGEQVSACKDTVRVSLSEVKYRLHVVFVRSGPYALTNKVEYEYGNYLKSLQSGKWANNTQLFKVLVPRDTTVNIYSTFLFDPDTYNWGVAAWAHHFPFDVAKLNTCP